MFAAKSGLKSVMFAGWWTSLNEIMKSSKMQQSKYCYVIYSGVLLMTMQTSRLIRCHGSSIIKRRDQESYERIHRTNIKDFDKVWENVEKYFA